MNDSETERHTVLYEGAPTPLLSRCEFQVCRKESEFDRCFLDVSQFVLDEQSVIRDPQDVCTRQSGVEERERDRFERGTLFSTFRHHVVVPCRIITIDSGISTHSV